MSTLSFEETNKILIKFLRECEKFWVIEKKNYSHNHTEEINVKLNALQDILNIRNDPYSPNGSKLNPIAKAKFLKESGMSNELIPYGEIAKVGDSIRILDEDGVTGNIYIVKSRYFEGGIEDNGIIYLNEDDIEYTSFDGTYEIVAYCK